MESGKTHTFPHLHLGATISVTHRMWQDGTAILILGKSECWGPTNVILLYTKKVGRQKNLELETVAVKPDPISQVWLEMPIRPNCNMECWREPNSRVGKNALGLSVLQRVCRRRSIAKNMQILGCFHCKPSGSCCPSRSRHKAYVGAVELNTHRGYGEVAGLWSRIAANSPEDDQGLGHTFRASWPATCLWMSQSPKTWQRLGLGLKF